MKRMNVVPLSLVFAAAASLTVADEPAKAPAEAKAPAPASEPKGAKALFGAGMQETFLPRQEGPGGTRQMNPSANVTEAQLTGFYKTPEFPGMAYSVEVIRAGENNVISISDPRTYEFATGDRIRIRLVPNYTGHAYVLEAKSGNDQLVYPVSFGSDENLVTAGRECYVPASGWLRLTDPPAPFVMKVLFKPGRGDYGLNAPAPNPAAARVAITEAVSREWQTQYGSKGIVFESDRSYINVPAAGGAPGAAPQPAGGDYGSAPMAVPAVLQRADYTTNYVAFNDAEAARANPAIAIEVPVNQISGRFAR